VHVSVFDLNLNTHIHTLVIQRYHDSSVCVRVSVCDLNGECVFVCV